MAVITEQIVSIDDHTKPVLVSDRPDISTWVTFGATAILCIGFATFSAVPGWSFRMGALLLVLPLGLVALGRLAVRRDVPALWLTGALMWAIAASFLHEATTIRLVGTLGLEASVLIYVGAAACWALGRGLAPSDHRPLALIAIGTLALSALVGVLQVTFQFDEGPLGLADGRAHGLTTYSVYFGALMAGAGVLLATIEVPQRWQWAQLTGVFGFAIANGLSGSRAASLALIAAMAWLLARRPGRMSIVTTALSVAGLAAAALASWAFSDGSDGSSLARVGGNGVAGGGIRWRIDGWTAGLDAFSQRPLHGWGVGNFRQAIQGSVGPAFEQDAPRFDAHNIVVELLVTLGVPGLALFSVFAVICVMNARGPLAIAAFVLAVQWLLQPAGISTLPICLLLLGASMSPRGLDDATVTTATEFEPAERVDHTVGLLALISVVLMIGWLAIDLRLARATEAANTDSLAAAATWYPHDPVVADLVAQSSMLDAFELEQAGVSEGPDFDRASSEALVWSQRAADRQPDSTRWLESLAARQAGFGLLDEALVNLDRVLELQPERLSAWRLLERIAVEVDDTDLATEAGRRVCQLGGC